MPPPFSMGVEDAYSITAVRTHIRPVRNANGFRAKFIEKIGVLDWNFIHIYTDILS